MKDEIKILWESRKSPLKVHIRLQDLESQKNKELNSLINESQVSSKAIFWRDVREVVAAIFVAIAFFVISLNTSDWVRKIASYLILLTAILIAYKLLAVKKYKKNLGNPNEDLLTYLKSFRLYWQKEIALFDTALYWYVLPIYISIVLFSVGKYWDFASNKFYLLTCTCVGIYIVWINKRAARKEKKWLAKIDEQIELLEK